MPLNNHNQFLTDLQRKSRAIIRSSRYADNLDHLKRTQMLVVFSNRKSTCNTAVEETLIYPIPKDTQFVCIRREKVTVRSNGDVEAVQEVVEDELVEEVEADEIQMAAAASD
uniref:Uncharacterized protein n=1 Tax=Magallana gigas TaxID=29159 RepID=A0A8W8N4P9_MAGGI